MADVTNNTRLAPSLMANGTLSAIHGYESLATTLKFGPIWPITSHVLLFEIRQPSFPVPMYYFSIQGDGSTWEQVSRSKWHLGTSRQELVMSRSK